MKEKSQVLKSHSRGENSSHHKLLKERHHSNKDKNDSERHSSSNKTHGKDRNRSSKESGKKKSNFGDEMAYDESYEELSRKKRKIERELQALDLEEAAAKKQKAEKKSKYHNVVVKDEPLSDDDRHLTTERNRKKIEKKTSKYHNDAVKDEPQSNDDRHLTTERNRQRVEKKPSRHHNVNIKNEPHDEHDRHSAPERNRQRPEKAMSKSNDVQKAKDKEKPDFAVSGKLAEDTNIFNGVVIKYNEPSEARKPKRRWRLYPFKGESDLPFIPIHRQSAYLLGRTRSIADIPIDHPSCSKQHAVLQFRLVPYTREDGTKGRHVRPYIIDLESANGTFVNNNRVDPRCYVELMEKDVIKFGFSSREYVLLHEESKDDDYDDVADSS